MSEMSEVRVLDAVSLCCELGDELVVRSVRDTHLAVAERVGSLTRRATGGASAIPELAHRQIATAVYAGIGVGLRATSSGLARLADAGVGPPLAGDARSRLWRSAVHGLVADGLLAHRTRFAITMAPRVDHRDVALDPRSLTAAYPRATGNVVVFVHGLCGNEDVWQARHGPADRSGPEPEPTYGEHLETRGWTPVNLRLNSGLPVWDNGALLASLMRALVDSWPTEIRRVAFVGHSMGGLVVRAAGAVAGASPATRPWVDRVSDVVTLGTPHLGAPLARGVGHGSRGLGRWPETAAFGRILDRRSRGVHDLVAGLTAEVAPWPHARYHLVAATLTRRPRHPVGHLVGDLLVRPGSAYARDRTGVGLLPDADVLHVGGTDHLGLLHHREVRDALASWLGPEGPSALSALGEQGSMSRGSQASAG